MTPTFETFMLPYLQGLSDGQTHTNADMAEYCAKALNLSKEDKAEKPKREQHTDTMTDPSGLEHISGKQDLHSLAVTGKHPSLKPARTSWHRIHLILAVNFLQSIRFSVIFSQGQRNQKTKGKSLTNARRQ